MKLTPLNLEEYFPFFLGTISNRWTTTSSRIYLDKFGIGIADWRVLASIASLEKASSNEIVALIAMDAGAVSRSMAKLADAGLVQTLEGKFAGRTKPYKLTKKGATLYAKIRDVALEREKTLLRSLSSEERKTLLRLMRKIMNTLDAL